jgi:protein-S-isoprenylcysteine O-methyltransferase Ste14
MMPNEDKPLVPAHPPSKADPIGALVGLLFTLLAALGLPLSKYLTAEELAVMLGAVMTVATGVRAVWQRTAARKAAGQ